MVRLLEILFYIFHLSLIRGKASTEAQRSNETVTLVFLGDINFDGPVRYYVEKGLSSYNTSFEYVAKYIREADYALGNLESPFGTQEMRKHPAPIDVLRKPVFLLAHPESVEALKFAGIDSVTLANNHMDDFKEDAVEFTLKILKQNGIDSFGVNRGKPNTSQDPVIKTINGIKIGFLGYCNISNTGPEYNDLIVRSMFKAGMTIYSEGLVKEDVKKLKEQNVDIIAVFVHWGGELGFNPNKSQKRMANFLLSLGVHVIVGAHPHVIQEHGFYNKSFLSYSIGHFLFGQHETSFAKFQSLPSNRAMRKITKETLKTYEKDAVRSLSSTKDTLILKIQITKDGPISASYLPCEILLNTKKKNLQPVPRWENHWIEVCGEDDKLCFDKSQKRPVERK